MKRHRTRSGVQGSVSNGNDSSNTDANDGVSKDNNASLDGNINENGVKTAMDSNARQVTELKNDDSNQRPARRLRSRDSTVPSANQNNEVNISRKDNNNKSTRGTQISHTETSNNQNKRQQESATAQPHKGRKIKRIKLSLRHPGPTVTHPDHVTQPKFDSLQSYLDSYKNFVDDELSNEEYESRVLEEIGLIKKLRTAIRNKSLKIDPVTSRIIKHPKEKAFIDPFITLPTHHDHLVAQSIKTAKLIQSGRRSKVAQCRKIANMVESHFKKLEGEKDRAIREHEKHVKKLARNTAMAVRKRWREVEKAYKIIVDRRREMEKIEESKKTMNRMVMDSSLRAVGHAISGARSETPTSLAESETSEEEEEEEDEAYSDVNESEAEKGSDQESEVEKEDEANKTLDSQNESKISADATLEKEEARNQGKELDEFLKITEQDKERFNAIKEESHDSLLDSDESLLDSDDDMSDSDDEEDPEEELEVGEEEAAGGGLASLFSNAIAQDDSDDEDVVESEVSDKTLEENVSREMESEEPEMESEEPKMESKESSENTELGVLKPEKEDLGTKLEDGNGLTAQPSKVDKLPDGTKQGTPSEEDAFASIPDVPVPSLLRGTLRAYQKQGLNWLANLYNNNTNGILADEMGLGKTIQTISLISYLACEKHIWGPHLIVVPTSVMLNWEMEFKRFAPGFKILTYYGNPQQRKEKRKGWNKPDAFHVCITSYQLVCHDHQSFRRRKWEYMILDEAHNIKNFRTTRWQSLLNFNTNRRLLLTGTPLQNNLAELWSLLYFLMPSAKNVSNMPEGFASLDDFQQWFGRPVDKIIEGGSFENDKETKETIAKLHKVLRPYLLRRLKADVETQMPLKYEHILYCRLSKRQRFLYDDFMSRAQTKETLASGNFLSIINCLMQLRKVCNHPDLFESRPVLTSLAIQNSIPAKYGKNIPNYLTTVLHRDLDLETLGFIFTNNEAALTVPNANSINKLNAKNELMKECGKLEELLMNPVKPNYDDISSFYKYFKFLEQRDALNHSKHVVYVNNLRCSKKPVYGKNLLDLLCVKNVYNDATYYSNAESSSLSDMIKPLSTRVLSMKDAVNVYAFVTPPVVTLDMKNQIVPETLLEKLAETDKSLFKRNSVHDAQVKLSIQFPDKSLLLYDSGKLQKLAKLLYELKNNGHRVLIFTQMTKVLDILEKFLNSLGYLYSRLDGATKIEDRQLLTEKFNRDPRITCFILSTRSGGLGINLTGADTVIFYDNDWNPAMDKQCQDRCHRIGQTRDVHIYRFVSEFTIEENIMKKSNYKRKLDNVVIQEGDFTTDYFGKLTLSDLLGKASGENGDQKLLMANGNIDTLAQAEDAEDAIAAKEAIKESEVDAEDFDEAAIGKSESPASANGNGTNKIKAQISKTSEIVDNPSEKLADSQTMDVDQEEEEYEDEDVGHIDEYMLRFIENGYYY